MTCWMTRRKPGSMHSPKTGARCPPQTAAAEAPAQGCGAAQPAALQWPADEIEARLHPNDVQRAALKGLQDANARAFDILSAECQPKDATTPPARLDAIGRAARCHAASGRSGERRARGLLRDAERRAEGAVRGDRTKANGVISRPLPSLTHSPLVRATRHRPAFLPPRHYWHGCRFCC